MKDGGDGAWRPYLAVVAELMAEGVKKLGDTPTDDANSDHPPPPLPDSDRTANLFDELVLLIDCNKETGRDLLLEIGKAFPPGMEDAH